jgi:hypothetical protein
MRSCVGQATLRALNVATTSGQLVATPPHAALTPHARRLRGGAGGRRGFCGRVLGAYGDKQVGEVGARRQARSQEARVESGSMRGGMPEDIRDAVAAVHRADAKAVLYIAGDRAHPPPHRSRAFSGFQHMWAATPAFPTPTQHSHLSLPGTHPPAFRDPLGPHGGSCSPRARVWVRSPPALAPQCSAAAVAAGAGAGFAAAAVPVQCSAALPHPNPPSAPYSRETPPMS